MKANLLVVTGDEIKDTITSNLEDHGFSLFFARGRLKVKEIFSLEKIDVIVWLFSEDEKGLAEDLVTIFNEHDTVPIVIITEKIVNYDFSESLSGTFTNIDLNDDVGDIRKTIEIACNQSIVEEVSKSSDGLPEIEFKNAVSQLVSDDKNEDKKHSDESDTLQLSSPWIAVGKKEKEIISHQLVENKKSKIKEIFQNWRKKS